jgi:hypothetical protein
MWKYLVASGKRYGIFGNVMRVSLSSILVYTCAGRCQNDFLSERYSESESAVPAFFFLVGVELTSPGTAATSGLLYSPR